MVVHINGEEREIESGLSVTQLLEELEIRPARVVVELNRNVLARDAFAARLRSRMATKSKSSTLSVADNKR